MGKQIINTGGDSAARKKVEKAVHDAVDKIDAQLLTGSQKMWIFDVVLMSQISWDLLIHDMCPSFVKCLGRIQTRMYKKWSHYAKAGDPSIFYRAARHHGWHMAEMVPYFKKMQLAKCHLLMTSSDPEVRQTVTNTTTEQHRLDVLSDVKTRLRDQSF